MIEEKIIEWLDLGESVQKVDIYQRKRLLSFFEFYLLLVSHGISSEIAEIIFITLFFLQIFSLAITNIEAQNDTIIIILKYIEKFIIPHKAIENSKGFLIFSVIIL